MPAANATDGRAVTPEFAPLRSLRENPAKNYFTGKN
jgi:hypothetical protein